MRSCCERLVSSCLVSLWHICTPLTYKFSTTALPNMQMTAVFRLRGLASVNYKLHYANEARKQRLRCHCLTWKVKSSLTQKDWLLLHLKWQYICLNVLVKEWLQVSFEKVNSSTIGCACIHFLPVRAHKSVREEARRKESFFMNAILINSYTIEPK